MKDNFENNKISSIGTFNRRSFGLGLIGVLLVFLVIPVGCKEDQSSAEGKKKFETVKQFSEGPVSVRVLLEKDQITIADTVFLRLEVEGGGSSEVVFPQVNEILAEENILGVLDYYNLPDRLVKGNRVVKARQYRLEPFEPGQFAIPAMKFIVQEKVLAVGSGEQISETAPANQYELTTTKIDIEVISLLDSCDVQIADIKEVVSLPGRPWPWWYWVIVGSVIIAGAGVVYLWRRRRKEQQQMRI